MITLNGLKGRSLASYRCAKQRIHNFVNFAQTDVQKTQVNLGWCRKVKCTPEERKLTGQKYKLQETTMSAEMMKKMPKHVKKTLFAPLVFAGLFFAKSSADAIVYIEKMPAQVARNIKKAKDLSLQKDIFIEGDKISLPVQLARATSDGGSAINRFLLSMKINKESLMKDLNIDDKTYDMYAKVALKIANEESKFGKSKKYKVYDFLESSKTGRKAISKIRKAVNGDGTLSLGLTRFKIDNASSEEKELFKKYGITFDNNGSNILQPEKSALATLIHLSVLDKDYPLYLAAARKRHPNLTSVSVRRSIENAKKILFDDERRPLALENLVNHNTSPCQASFVTNPAERVLSHIAKDMDDLRIYARTVELSPEAYLAARWNGKKIIPSGAKADIACRNLLNIIAQKGYIANIDKTSKVIY